MENFYQAVNDRNLEKAMSFVSPDAIYEDFTFQEPFKGTEGVRELLSSAMELPRGLNFVFDEVAGGDGWGFEDSVGVTWHVELNGTAVANGRGASLYRTRGGRLVYARDVVESPLKLGAVIFGFLSVLAPLLRSGTALMASGFVAAAAIYWYVLLLSPAGQFQFLSGPPAWAIDEQTLRNVVDESLNFFYIWPGLDALGLSMPLMTRPEVEPLRLALFNFSEAFALMFLPLLMWDRPSRKDVVTWWAPAMFLTNAILLPYFATRALDSETPRRLGKPSWSPLFGATALGVAAIAVWQSWAHFAGLPELLLGDRVAFAFAVDCALFSLLQVYVLDTAGPWRFVPFFGLAFWLMKSDANDE